MASKPIKRIIKPKQLSIKDKTTNKVGHNSTLQIQLQEAHKQLSMEERQTQIGLLDTIKSTHYEELNKGFLIHIVQYYDGGSISIVPKSKKGLQKADLIEKKAPKTGDFLDKECFVYINDNHALLLSSRIKDKTIEDYLTYILRKTKDLSNEQSVSINNIADPDVIKKIRENGVKRIQIKSSVDPAVWAYSAPKSEELPILQRISLGLKQICSTQNDISDKELGNYSYELSINNKGTLEALENDILMESSVELYENPDDDTTYAIVLNNNKGEIKGESLSLKQTVYISRAGNSLNLEHVKKALVAYRDTLRDDEMINA